MSVRVASIEANTEKAVNFILWINERYITFWTALQDTADAVFHNPDWEITVHPDEDWVKPVTITKANCGDYRRENSLKLNYKKELKELLAWKKERENALRSEEEFCIANGIEF